MNKVCLDPHNYFFQLEKNCLNVQSIELAINRWMWLCIQCGNYWSTGGQESSLGWFQQWAEARRCLCNSFVLGRSADAEFHCGTPQEGRTGCPLVMMTGTGIALGFRCRWSSADSSLYNSVDVELLTDEEMHSLCNCGAADSLHPQRRDCNLQNYLIN